MTDEQKRYIEHNIELIENNEWAKFFSTLMRGLGGIIYEAGIDFMTELGYVPRGAFKESNVQRVVIPDGVTEIGYYAFQGCTNLTSINIPDSVTSIGDGAFFDCGNININYNGTVAEWKTLIGNNSKVFKYTLYTCTCTDGVIRKSR